MGGLLSALNTGKISLSTNQKAIEVTGNNIANVNNEDYSRQTPELSPTPTLNYKGLFIGTGVKISDITRSQDVFVTNQLQEKYADFGEANAKSSPLSELERVFSISEEGLATEIDKFFDSWQELSVNPGGITERQMVIQQGELLTDAFRDARAALDSVQQNIDDSLVSKVTDININLDALTELNSRIATLKTAGTSPNSFLDQRDAILQDLTESLGVQVYEDEAGMVSVQLPGGVPLVQGSSHLTLTGTVVNGLTQFSIVDENVSIDISVEDVGGEFGGMLDVRDNLIPDLGASLDELAYNIVTSVNTQHQAGVGLDDVSGRSFFADLDPDPAIGIPGACRNMSVALTSTTEVAAGTDTGSGAMVGDNTNALLLASLATQKVINGTTSFTDYYGNLTGQVGLEAAQNNLELSNADDTIVQLKNLRDGVQGVSLEEEMISLMQYQKGFEASAKFLTAVDEMMTMVISMKG
ncbi:MAG: flagellar hook-associated protein FlgK [Deltaproteobacteria bacterium]|nr:flagellar hook-associated protein FlgK [Deltaproteobacteria bacterium]